VLCAITLVASAEAFMAPAMIPAAHNRRASARLQGAVTPLKMALTGTEKVVVYGGFERIAVTIMKTLADSGFRAVCPVPKGFTSQSKIKWGIDGLPQTIPVNVLLSDDGVPVVEGCVLASEEPVTGEECVGALQNLLAGGLSKVVFLSKVGVDRRDNFMIKMNPFLKIDTWYKAEEAVKKWCAENSVECTILRTGKLEGGPFFQTQREFQSALEASLFDVENKAMKVSTVDNVDGMTSRDLVATAVRQALIRDVPVFSVVSAKTGPLTCSVLNHMDLSAANSKDRKVYTPSPEEWDAAFAQI